MEWFIKLDEDFSSDPKIRKLRRSLGREAVLDYIEMLPIFRRFPDRGYQIPFDELSDIAECDLFTTEERLMQTVQTCIELGLFETDGETFWSRRRKQDLVEQEEVKRKQREGGKRGVEKRWREERKRKAREAEKQG